MSKLTITKSRLLIRNLISAVADNSIKGLGDPKDIPAIDHNLLEAELEIKNHLLELEKAVNKHEVERLPNKANHYPISTYLDFIKQDVDTLSKCGEGTTAGIEATKRLRIALLILQSRGIIE